MPHSGVGHSDPIFLAGVDRSGIGLLGEILECHPDVSMTRRTNFWMYYDARFGDLAEPHNLEHCLDEMMRSSRMRVLEPNRENLRRDFAAGEATYARLFELLQVGLMERRGRSRWGDKSLGSERFAGTILSAYPSARFVHVIRDPRDRYASQKHHRGPVRGGAGSGAALWRWSIRLASSNLERFEARYCVVRYEDLATDPPATLHKVRQFLHLPEPNEAALDSTPPSPLVTGSIGRYREDLSRPDRHFIEVANRQGMRRWGYDSEPRSLDASAQLRFWGGAVPVRTISGIRWQLTAKIRDRQGRNPAPRRLD